MAPFAVQSAPPHTRAQYEQINADVGGIWRGQGILPVLAQAGREGSEEVTCIDRPDTYGRGKGWVGGMGRWGEGGVQTDSVKRS